MNIKAENINITLEKNNILKDINIEVDNKEVVGIIGPNGSGKSTFLKCIYRVLKPSDGAILLDKVDIKDMTVKESSKRLAVLSQHNNYNFDFTVKDIVLMGRSPHKRFMERDNKEDYAIVNDALKKVEMLEFKDRCFQSLSGGEQQRVAIARAIVNEPKLLLCDEPTGNLDPDMSMEIMQVLEEINKSCGTTIIMATHDKDIVNRMKKEVIVLKDGHLVKHVEKGEYEE